MIDDSGEETLYMNRNSDMVPWEDLGDAEVHFYEDGVFEDGLIEIGNYCQNWERDNFAASFDLDDDDE